MTLNDTDRLILAKLTEGRAKPGYLASELGKQQAYINQRLSHLVDEDLVVRIHRGLYGHAALEGDRVDAARLVGELSVLELIDPTQPTTAADLEGTGDDTVADTGEGTATDTAGAANPADTAESTAEEDGSSPSDPRGETGQTTPQPAETTDTADTPDFSTLDLPGSGERLDERRRAVALAYEYIRQQGTAQVQNIKSEIFDRTESGYKDATSLWKNAVYDALRDLAEEDARLSPPGAGEQVWTYRDSVEEGGDGVDVYDPMSEFE